MLQAISYYVPDSTSTFYLNYGVAISEVQFNPTSGIHRDTVNTMMKMIKCMV